MRIFTVAILILMLSGCAIHTQFYDKEDNLIGHVKQGQPGAATVETEGLKMSVDTRKQSLAEKIAETLSNTVGSASQKTAIGV